MIKRVCPVCGIEWFSANTSGGSWFCPECWADITEEAEEPVSEEDLTGLGKRFRVYYDGLLRKVEKRDSDVG